MRANEFIEPAEQLRLMTRIVNDTRAKLDYDVKTQIQSGSTGEQPLDFLKKVIDVAWDEVTRWVALQSAGNVAGSEPIEPSSLAPAKTVMPQSSLNKSAVARASSSGQAKQPQKAKQAKPKSPKSAKKPIKKPIKPKRVVPRPAPTPVPQPVKRVTPINPNPGQPLPRIKPYGTMNSANKLVPQ